MDWSTACPSWESKIVRGESLIPFAPLFPAEAESALKVFRGLRIVDAHGSPTFGAVSRPWILDFVSAVFGAYDPGVDENGKNTNSPTTGRRLINEFLLLISKKNGKSTTAAGIMMTALIRNWRESAEFLILAPTVEIANNSFYPARDMVRRDEELSDLMHVQEHIRTITNRRTNATLKVVAAENETVGGKKATGILIDEFWLFGKQANAENMLREACGGLASRPEGFVIYLTTQADAAPAGVWRQKLQYARAVRDGTVIDKRFLPVLYEFPAAMVKRGAPPLADWCMTNPNLGASVDPEFLAHKLQEAEHAGQESLLGFYAKHANIEIGLALRSDSWVAAPFWEHQSREWVTLESILARCEVITVGVDGGGMDDMLGLAVLGRDRETHDWLLWTHAWLHPIALDRRKSEAARYRDFERDGDLTIIEALPEDVSEIAAIIKRVSDTGLMASIGLDPEKTHKVMLQALVDVGIDEKLIFCIPQGWKLCGAISVAERKIAEGALLHGGRPLMAWCVSNAKVEPKGNATLITKQASGWAKIDPLMSMFSAVSLMALNPAGAGKSFWEKVA